MNFQEFLARKQALALVEHMNALSEADALELFNTLDEETIEFIEAVLSEVSRAKATRALASMQAKGDPEAGEFETQRFKPMFKHRFIPKEDDMGRRIAQGTTNIVRRSSDPQNTIDQTNKLIDSVPKKSTSRMIFKRAMIGQLGWEGHGGKITRKQRKKHGRSRGFYKQDELTDQQHQARKDLIKMAAPKSDAQLRGVDRDQLATRMVPVEGGSNRPETTKEKMKRLAGERLAKHNPYQ